MVMVSPLDPDFMSPPAAANKLHHCPQQGCEHKGKFASHIKKHLADVHDIDVVWHYCPHQGCEYKAKRAGGIKRHLADFHDIGVTWHHCPQQGCEHKTKRASRMKQHLADAHDIGVTWYHCPHEGCEYKAKQSSQIKQHLAGVHDIGVVWYHCPHEGCEYKAKCTSSIKQHLAGVHDIDVVWYHCPHQGCEHKAKSACNAKQHLADAHNIGVTWHHCSEKGCEHKAKYAAQIKRHLADVHDIGVTWYHCPQQGCDHKAKNVGDIKKHLADAHDIGVVWHDCPQPGCEHKAKSAGNARKHLEGVHDVGDHECDYCAYNRFKLIEYFCPKWAITSQICRGCHNTVTGKKVRKETEWSNYIDEHFGTEYLLLSDKSLASVGGCIRERPDKLHTSPDLVILSECDEFEHMYKNGAYTCEEERVSKIYDEAGICGKTMVVIRWNPDGYQLPEGGGYRKLKKAERLELHVAVMNFILAHPEVIQGMVHVFYLLFSPDNPKIARHYPVSMIYNKSDLEVDENGNAQVNTVMPMQLL